MHGYGYRPAGSGDKPTKTITIPAYPQTAGTERDAWLAKWGGDLLGFDDALAVSDWAYPALRWASGAGIVQGDDDSLNPKAGATRAEAAAMPRRFCENV